MATACATGLNNGDNAAEVHCSAVDLLRWSGMPIEGESRLAPLLFLIKQLAAGQVLALEGAPLEFFYLVRSGTLKVIQTGPDGYEQVHAFAMKGDMLGLDGLHDERHATGATALETSQVVLLPLRQWQRITREHPALARLHARSASLELARRGASLHCMAAVAAEVRLARFLLQLSARQALLAVPPTKLLLRMSRREIASLLGVSHESVSRSFSALATEGLIRVHQKDIDLLDEAGLIARQSMTRPERDGHALGVR